MKKVDSLLPGPVGLSSTLWSHCLTWELSSWHLVDVPVGEPNLGSRQAIQCRSFMLKMNPLPVGIFAKAGLARV